jgi:hypothetical protein
MGHDINQYRNFIKSQEEGVEGNNTSSYSPPSTYLYEQEIHNRNSEKV